MATSSNSRDVKMTLSVETLGSDEIKKLQGSVAALAKEGGDAAPEFQHLADEIGRLGEQAAALQAFQQLADETGTLSEQQARAAVTAAELRAKWEALSETTKGAVAHQRASAAALLDAREAARATRDELAILSATTDRAGKSEDEYTSAVQKLKVAKVEQRAEIERLSAALSAANTEVKQAETAESKLAEAYKRAATAADTANRALQTNTTEVSQAAESARTLGVTTENVAASQAQLVQGLNQSGRAAETLDLQIRQLADQERELAAVGAFEKQAEAARRLVVAGEYAELFDQALQRLAATERELQAQSNEAKWQREAHAMVEAAESARKLAHEAELLTAVERELAAQSAFEKQAQDARQLVQAGDYVRFWREELDKAEQQATLTAQTAQAASQKISDAFRTLGVRSAQELQAEITQVRVAMETVRSSATGTGTALSGAFAAGEAKIKSLEREIRQVSGTLTTADRAAKLFSNSLGQISAGNIIADGVGYLVNKVKELGTAFLAAIVGGDQMRRGLNAIYKDATITAQQIDFLRKASSESGVAFGSLSGEFVKFSASMKLSNIPLEQSNNLFKAVTAASASLGLGAEATAGTLNALGQMASKGNVSLEELRAQIGDRLPGALGLAAKGLGITEGQLIKLIESGQLATRDFVVPFTQALGQLKGETDGLVPTWERFKGVLSEAAQSMAEAGGMQLLTGTLKLLGGTVAAVTLVLSAMTEGLFLVGKAVLAFYGTLTGDGATAWAYFNEEAAKSRDRLVSMKGALDGMLDPTAAAANAVSAHTSALGANAAQGATTSAATAHAAQSLSAHTAEVVKSIAANTGLDAVQKLAALSTKLAADATLDASAKYVQYSVAAAELLKSQAGQTEAFEKLAKAAKEQGNTLVETAKLTGDHTAVQAASAAAAKLYADALDKVSASQSAETQMLIAQKVELEASALKRGLTTDQIKTQVDALDKLIAKSRAETEQSAQAQAAAHADLVARQLAVEVLKDHSKQVGEFKLAIEAAAATLKEYERLAREGKTTEAEVQVVREALTKATVLYRDALQDAVKAHHLETQAKSASAQVSIAATQATQNHNTALAAEATALGNTAEASRLTRLAKEAGLNVMRQQLDLAKQEQTAALAEIELKRKLIDGTTDEGKAKLVLLDIERDIIKVKQAGNQAKEDEIAATRRVVNGVTALTDAYHQLGLKAPEELNKIAAANKSAWDKVSGDANASVETLKAAFNTYAQSAIAAAGSVGSEQYNVTKEVLKTEAAAHGLAITFDATGKAIVTSQGEAQDALKKTADAVDDVTAALMRQNEAQEKVIAAQEKEINLAERKKALEDKKNRVDSEGFQINNKGERLEVSTPTERSVYEQAKGQGLSEAQALQIMNQFMQNGRQVITGGGLVGRQNGENWYTDLQKAIDRLVLQNASKTATTGGQSSSTQTININIGGRTTSVNVASAQDAAALTSVLRQLESGKGTSS